MKNKIIILLTILFISTNVEASRTLILARAPQLSPTVTSQLWSPFVNYLSEKTGIKISLKIYKERSEFESDIKEGKVDLYFANPGYAVVGNQLHGYIPVVRSDKKLLEGIILVKKDSNITTIEQLNGKVIAFPDETAFAASLYLRSRLDTDFHIKYQPLFTGSHDNTYRAVLIGKAAAGGGVIRTLENEKAKFSEQLQIIYTTPGMKSHPLMVHPQIPEDVRISIQKAILSMNNDDAGKKLLKDVSLRKPVIADYSRDYRSIEPFVFKMYQFLLN